MQVVAAYAGPDPVLALGDGDGDYPDDIAAIVEADRPGRQQGLVSFTGLSGSGKSTVAQAVIDSLLEHGEERTVTSLDGDVVRRTTCRRGSRSAARTARPTSAGSAGSPRRSAPRRRRRLQPDRAVRRDPRGRPAMTAAAGGAFFLVHVATPWRSASAATARASTPRLDAARSPTSPGSPPYEAPDDADLRLDTTGRSIEDCRDEVLAALAAAGYVWPGRLGVERVRRWRDAGDHEPIRVLFVCTANICRSPYLELRAVETVRARRRRRGQQRRHRRVRRRSGQRHHGRGVRALGHRGRRVPEPAGDR